MPQARPVLIALLALALTHGVVNLTAASSQTEALRRVTSTAPVSININPSLSGDGRRVAFETTAAVEGAGNRSFQLARIDITAEPFSLSRLAATRAPSPAISQDGSRLAFSSTDDPLGTNPQGNAEIFFYDESGLSQLTETAPDDSSRRATEGCFQPSISDDGMLIAFSSNRDLTGANTDRNFEIFMFDARTRDFMQLTESTGITGATDAKLSGDGSHIAYLLDRLSGHDSASTKRDIMLFDRASLTSQLVAGAVDDAAFTYGRAISDDGARFVYAATTGTNARQVFLYDGRNHLPRRQLTTLGSRALDVPLHPTISGDGSRVAFATRRRVTDANTDASVELYLYDIPTNSLTRITNAPSGATGEVVSSLNDDGSAVAFSFPRVLTDSSAPEDFVNNAEIYLAALAPRPPFSSDLRILNGASLDKVPEAARAIAPDSIAVARGTRLALSAVNARRAIDGTFPQILGGTTVTIEGRAAQLYYVSPTQVNFHVPPEINIGPAEVVVRNPDGFESRGAVLIRASAPGLFTQGGGGTGAVIALESSTLRGAPFDALDSDGDPTRLILFATGARRATDVALKIAGRPVKVESIIASPDLPGLDQIHIALSSRLKGSGTVPAVVRSGGIESNSATLSVTNGGGAPRPASVQLSPAAITIPVGGTMQFAAIVRDVDDEVITNAPIDYVSENGGVAQITAGGLVEAIHTGEVTITATSARAAATARLRVVDRTLVINEALADPPDGLEGDANRDKTRSSADDEFVELVNGTNDLLDIAGWTLKTRPLTGTTESTRHTFGASAAIPAGDALVVFGGGDFVADDPAFGGAQVLKATSGGLSLINSGLTILVRDAAGNLVTQVSYGTAGDNLGGNSIGQSLTRAPDITGRLTRHTAAAAAKKFSPGTKLDGSFFAPRAGRLSRIEIEPLVAAIFIEETALFTARAFDQFNRPLPDAVFTFSSSETNVASVDRIVGDSPHGTAMATLKGRNQGTTTVTALATIGSSSLKSPPVTLQVSAAPPKILRVEMAPTAAAINRGATQQFHAVAFDENGHEVTGAIFQWSSGDGSIATVNETGLAGGAGVGACSIKAMTSDARGGVISGETTLSVQVPLVINEILADVPPDNASTIAIEGDANRDGVRSGSDDEFVELLNNSHDPLDISGIILADSTINRFTFPAHTMLAPGRAVLIFGGGTPPPADPAFGGALVFNANALGLNDSGDTVTLKLPRSGTYVTLAAVTFGTDGTSPPAPSNQSLTRVPDTEAGQAGGAFLAHSDSHLPQAAGRVFSPGTRADGTPFGSPRLTRIIISPASAIVDIGVTQALTAHAFGDAGGVEMEIPAVSFVWDSSDASKVSLVSLNGPSTIAQALADGAININARAGGITSAAALTVNPPPPVLSRVTISPASSTLTVGATERLNAQAFDQFDHPLGNVAIDFISNNTHIVTINDLSVDQSNGSAKAGALAVGAGTALVTARAMTAIGQSVTSSPSSFTITPPPPRVSRIEITPQEASIGVGETQQFAAQAFDGDNQIMADVKLMWASSNARAAIIDERGLVQAVGAGSSHITAAAGAITSNAALLTISGPPVPVAGQVIINEALVSFTTSTTQARSDFVELKNITDRTLDISGLVVTFRPAGSGSATSSVTLPGTVGSNVTLLPPRAYFLIVNGATTFGVPADFNTSPKSFDLNGTTGGVKIEVDGVKLDGLSYQGSATALVAPFNSFGEGSILIFTSGITNDLIRSPDARDTNDNGADFRRSATTGGVTPRAVNPTLP